MTRKKVTSPIIEQSILSTLIVKGLFLPVFLSIIWFLTYLITPDNSKSTVFVNTIDGLKHYHIYEILLVVGGWFLNNKYLRKKCIEENQRISLEKAELQKQIEKRNERISDLQKQLKNKK